MVYRSVAFHIPAHLLQRLVSVAQRRPLLMPPLGSVIPVQTPVCVNTLLSHPSHFFFFVLKGPAGDVCYSAVQCLQLFTSIEVNNLPIEARVSERLQTLFDPEFHAHICIALTVFSEKMIGEQFVLFIPIASPVSWCVRTFRRTFFVTLAARASA